MSTMSQELFSREVEAMLGGSFESQTLTRWERKATEAKTPLSSRKKSLHRLPNLSTPGKPEHKTPYNCRFIPNREAMKSGDSTLSLDIENMPNQQTENKYHKRLAQSLFDDDGINSKVLSFKHKAPKPSNDHLNQMRVLYSQNKAEAAATTTKKPTKHIPSTAERILDAPDIVDDFYINVMDWSQKGDQMLAVALSETVYLWNPSTGDIACLTELENCQVTSVKWMCDGGHLAIGTSSNEVQLWNVGEQKRVRTMDGHSNRVSALAWSNHILSSGSRDRTIIHHDVRIANHSVAVLQGHTGEVCGLEWSPDGSRLASGSNDNTCCLWDVNTHSSNSNSRPVATITEHTAAVKALAWCPWQSGVLATGGGTGDRHIRIFNTQSETPVCLNSINTENQVCSLVWSPREKELLSGHGFSQNSLMLWRYPSMARIGMMNGHSERVLQCCLSADGTTVVSAGADETLRFWRVWDAPEKKRVVKQQSLRPSAHSNLSRNIR